MPNNLRFAYPENYQPVDKSIYYFVGEDEKLPNATLKRTSGVFDIVSGENKSLWWLLKRYILVILGKKQIKNISKAAWVTNRYSFNYFHWINDVLPKLVLLEENGIKCPIVLPAHFAAQHYIRESLAIMGWEYLATTLNTVCVFKSLYIPSATADSGSQHPQYFGKVVNRLKGQSKSGSKSRKVYISRKDSPFRNVHPENQVEELLQTGGFEIISLEGKTLGEQIDLFSECSHLVAVHGAGLTNMAFMQPGTRVLEIRRSDDKLNYCYFKMANVLNHKYYYFLAEGEDVSKPVQLDNLIIDVDVFKETLNQFLSSSEPENNFDSITP